MTRGYLTTSGDGCKIGSYITCKECKYMKILKLTSENLKFWKNINLLDGQRKGEVIFRRSFVLIVGALIVYLLLLVFVGKKEDNSTPAVATETIVELGVDGSGNVRREGEVVNGQKVEVENGKAVYIQPTPAPTSKQIKAIKKFTQTYRGSRINDKYFDLLASNCSVEALRVVVAISVAETGMGRDVKRQSNFFGWFAGGNRNYDPDQKTMAKVICSGVEKSYIGIGSSVAKAKKYVGNNPTNWLRNYRWAYAQMEVK